MFSMSAILTAYIILNPGKAPDQFNVFGNNEGNMSINTQNQIALYINKNFPNSTILMDTFTSFSVVLSSEHPGKLIVSSSLNFYDAIKNPRAFGINYILVPNSKDSLGSLDTINIYYPKLYEKGENWCILQKEFNNYRLYKVL
jgi:hypothetical protein